MCTALQCIYNKLFPYLSLHYYAEIKTSEKKGEERQNPKQEKGEKEKDMEEKKQTDGNRKEPRKGKEKMDLN